MRNILARGGIEFLAVLLGISGSLWIDDSSTNRNDRTQEYEAYSRLSNAMEKDIINIKKALIENNEMVDILMRMIDDILIYCKKLLIFMIIIMPVLHH